MFLFLIANALLKQSLHFSELAINSKVEVSKKPLIITIFDQYLILHSYLTLLESFLMNSFNILQALGNLAIASSQMTACKAQTCFEHSDSKHY